VWQSGLSLSLCHPQWTWQRSRREDTKLVTNTLQICKQQTQLVTTAFEVTGNTYMEEEEAAGNSEEGNESGATKKERPGRYSGYQEFKMHSQFC